MPDDGLPQNATALKMLQDRGRELDRKLRTDAQAAPEAQVAIAVGLAAEDLSSRIAGLSARVTLFGDASGKHLRALARWTGVLAVAAMLLVIVTAVLAVVTARPAGRSGVGSEQPKQETSGAAVPTPAVVSRLKGLRQVALETQGTALTSTLLAEIQAEVEAAGLQVISRSQIDGIPGRPLLHLEILSDPFAPKDAPAWAVSVSLREVVVLQRSPSVAFETETWSWRGARQGDLSKYVMDAIAQFVGAYRAANGH
jgi:hypothetical protein